MIDVVTPEEMKAVDQAAPEPVEVLIERAGAAVARAATDVLGGSYGRRVVVVAGKGNNGADGRAAARRLEGRGVRCTIIDARDAEGTILPPADLVIDAAYGTGFRGSYDAPDPGGAAVLAVDIPSGVDGLTGEAGDGAVTADVTVTFAALKPGLLLGEGPERAGVVEVVDIGLDTSTVARAHLVELTDVLAWLPPVPREAHKYRAGVAVVAGSPGMTGAALLCTRAAMRAGSGYVRLGSPGVSAGDLPIGEHVGRTLPAEGWDADVLDDLDRYRALVVGPGLGRAAPTLAAVGRLVSATTSRGFPTLVDGDALHGIDGLALAPHVVLTPHDGEFAHLTGGRPPQPDRMADVRALAARLGATVLLKGSTTVVSDPGGAVLFSTGADARLATAGTGDVLSGITGSFLAQGVAPLEAAAGAARVHAAAGHLGFRRGLVAGDLPDLVPRVLTTAPETR